MHLNNDVIPTGCSSQQHTRSCHRMFQQLNPMTLIARLISASLELTLKSGYAKPPRPSSPQDDSGSGLSSHRHHQQLNKRPTISRYRDMDVFAQNVKIYKPTRYIYLANLTVNLMLSPASSGLLILHTHSITISTLLFYFPSAKDSYS